MWQTLTYCLCSTISDFVVCTQTSIWKHVYKARHAYTLHTHPANSVQWVESGLASTDSKPLPHLLRGCRLYLNINVVKHHNNKHTHTHHHHHHHQTAHCILTTQVQVCELCQVWQALTYCLRPIYSDAIIWTRALHNHITNGIVMHTQHNTHSTSGAA